MRLSCRPSCPLLPLFKILLLFTTSLHPASATFPLFLILALPLITHFYASRPITLLTYHPLTRSKKISPSSVTSSMSSLCHLIIIFSDIKINTIH
ncbi:hypothetical protein BKA57DRAFT_460320 [Linnemannia elongata]|nr:hypothetical protein BKA57DRAFT_460320 [Linnemannia elongata]